MSERKKYSLTRKKILEEAYDRCMAEMFEKAQPAGDIHEYIRKIKAGEITKEDQEKDPIYNRHYLSHEEEKYIVDKYVHAYRMQNEFKSDCDVLLNDMEKGYPVDKYIDEHDDEHGHHPGYRSYEDLPPLVEQVKKLVGDEEMAKKVTDLFKGFIENRKEFYRFDRDEEKFSMSIWLGAIPTSNKETVKDYYKKHGFPEPEIKDRDPEHLWYIDEGWTDEEIAEEFADLERTKYNDEEGDE